MLYIFNIHLLSREVIKINQDAMGIQGLRLDYTNSVEVSNLIYIFQIFLKILILDMVTSRSTLK